MSPLTSISLRTFLLSVLCLSYLALGLPVTPTDQIVLSPLELGLKDTKVLILGGGVAGVIAARTLQEQGISDFIIVEARHELGGRMMSRSFGAEGQEYTVEVGANWVQGTQTEDGPENPIWDLAKRHNITTQQSSFFDSITTFDETGPVDYRDIFDTAVKNYAALSQSAGSRVHANLVDTTARGGYSLTGAQPSSPHEFASEYFQFDWEFAQSPEETSWVASSWANNFTFRGDAGGFSDENMMSVDQRGFKTLIQSEARSFLENTGTERVMLNSTVSSIEYSVNGVRVNMTDGRSLSADHALCTFSLGVLQHTDVKFEPALPAWKKEAIHSMSMGVYTKIFFQFPYKFWFDTEMGLYAGRERGRYAVWQSLDHPDFFPGSGLLFVTITGSFSKRIESLPNEYVKYEVLSVLQSMFPNITIPEPLDFYFHRWHADPLFRGSYSNWPASFLSEHQANLRANVDERLWFAGEATSRKHFGFLHGAYFEGRDIALAVADCIKGGGCVGLEHVERIRNARPYQWF
ncbi:amine oxidase [Abortiporus biennis]|nr:amine oxidase [Abortiporus biennis]